MKKHYMIESSIHKLVLLTNAFINVHLSYSRYNVSEPLTFIHKGIVIIHFDVLSCTLMTFYENNQNYCKPI